MPTKRRRPFSILPHSHGTFIWNDCAIYIGVPGRIASTQNSHVGVLTRHLTLWLFLETGPLKR